MGKNINRRLADLERKVAELDAAAEPPFVVLWGDEPVPEHADRKSIEIRVVYRDPEPAAD